MGSSTVVDIRALLRSSGRSGRSWLRHVCELIKSVLYKDATDGCGRWLRKPWVAEQQIGSGGAVPGTHTRIQSVSQWHRWCGVSSVHSQP